MRVVSWIIGLSCVMLAFFVSFKAPQRIVTTTTTQEWKTETVSDANSSRVIVNSFEIKNNQVFMQIEIKASDESFKVALIKNEEIINEQLLVAGSNDVALNIPFEDAYELKIIGNQEYYHKLVEPYVTLRFAGDTNLSSRFTSVVNAKGPDYLWRDVRPLLKSADISFLNLETSVSTRGETTKQRLFFRTLPDHMQGMVNSGVDVVSIANNHTFDYGQVAFEDTINYLKDNNIEYAGGGMNKSDAMSVKYIEKKGVKFGFFAFNQVMSTAWAAGEERAGQVVYTDERFNEILSAIESANNNCDYLIVMTHWGVERSYVPSDQIRNIAYQMVDRGADIIVGTHPHVLQGVEVYKDKPIYYSVGNFIFTNKDERTANGALFELKVSKSDILGSKFYPTHIKDRDFNLLNKDDSVYQRTLAEFKDSNIFNVDIRGNRLIGI